MKRTIASVMLLFATLASAGTSTIAPREMEREVVADGTTRLERCIAWDDAGKCVEWRGVNDGPDPVTLVTVTEEDASIPDEIVIVESFAVAPEACFDTESDCAASAARACANHGGVKSGVGVTRITRCARAGGGTEACCVSRCADGARVKCTAATAVRRDE